MHHQTPASSCSLSILLGRLCTRHFCRQSHWHLRPAKFIHRSSPLSPSPSNWCSYSALKFHFTCQLGNTSLPCSAFHLKCSPKVASAAPGYSAANRNVFLQLPSHKFIQLDITWYDLTTTNLMRFQQFPEIVQFLYLAPSQICRNHLRIQQIRMFVLANYSTLPNTHSVKQSL